MMKEAAKIKTALADLDDLKRKQILAEIQSTKIKYIITILTMLGSFVAFCVLQKNNVIDFFKKKPTITFQAKNPIFTGKTKIDISDINGKPVVNSILKDLPANLELEQGSYNAKISLNGESLWSNSFLVRANENKTISLPDFFEGKIDLSVDNINPNPHIGDEINLDISSTGNGYLWIYEIINNDFKLKFPIGYFKDANTITADKSFKFPPGYGLVAGNEIKKEKYCFLVTSLNSENDANGFMQLLFPKSQSKGEITNIKKNWGAKIIEVNVKQ